MSKAIEKQRWTKNTCKIFSWKCSASECNKGFQTKRRLEIHIRSIHEGVKLNCNECDKHYTRDDDLKRHIRGDHKGERYHCHQCDEQFKQKYILNKHVRTKHGEDYIID